MRTNVRLTNERGEEGGQFFVRVDDSERIAYVQRLLAELRAEEPNMGWRLECRGEQTEWHAWGMEVAR